MEVEAGMQAQPHHKLFYDLFTSHADCSRHPSSFSFTQLFLISPHESILFRPSFHCVALSAIVLLYLLNISSCFHFFVAKHLWNHLFSSASRGSVTGVCPTEQNKSGEGRKKSGKKRNNFFSDLSFRKGVMNYILKGETEASCLYAFIEFQWREEASGGGEIQLAFATSARTVSNHLGSPWRCLTSCKLQHPFWHPEKVELSFN